MTDNIYAVRFLPSRKLMMLTDKAGLQVILRLNKEPIARLENESPCTFHNTKLHGTVEVEYWGEAWQIFGEEWEDLD